MFPASDKEVLYFDCCECPISFIGYPRVLVLQDWGKYLATFSTSQMSVGPKNRAEKQSIVEDVGENLAYNP